MEFPAHKMPEYEHLDARERMKKRHGSQGGDPVKAAKSLYELAVMKNPPSRIALGSDSYQIVMNKLDEYRKVYTENEALTRSTDIQD